MRPRIVAALVLLLVPGCLTAVAGAPDFRFVLVEGVSRADEPRLGICGYNSIPEVDEETRTIRFHNEGPSAGTRALVLAIVQDSSGCGTYSSTFGTLRSPTGALELDLGRFGGVEVSFLRDGRVQVDGRELTPGGLVLEAAGEGWNATASFRNLGTWPGYGLVSD